MRSKYLDLEKRGWAVRNPVLTEETRDLFHRLWIFVETSFDQTTFDSLTKANDSKEKPHINNYVDSDGYVNYQEYVVDTIRFLIMQRHADDIALNSVDVVLGSDWDIIVKVQARNPDPVHDFVITELRTCPFVLRTSTAWARSAGKNRLNLSDSSDDNDEPETD